MALFSSTGHGIVNSRSEPTLGNEPLRSSSGRVVLPQVHHHTGPHLGGTLTTTGLSRSVSGTSRHGHGPSTLPKTVASRLLLDATMAPHLIDLRMNHRNLANELLRHNGQMISGQCARIRLQQKPKEPKAIAPVELRLPGLTPQRKAALLRELAEGSPGRRLKGTGSDRFGLEDDHGKLDPQTGSSPGAAGAPSRNSSFKLHPSSQSATHDGTGFSDADDSESGLTEEESATTELAEDAEHDGEEGMILGPPHIPEQETNEVHDFLKGSDERLPLSRLNRAVEALGHAVPSSDVLDGLLKTQGKHGLSTDELLKLVTSLVHRRQHEVMEQFKALDADKSGSVSSREFRRLLWDRGYTVTEETAQEFLSEATGEHKKADVNAEEFAEALRLACKRHGFTQQESVEYLELFDKYDTDCSGQMSAEELAGALGWLGTPTTITQAEAIVQRFGDDGADYIVKPEFLRVMRLRLEEEHDSIRSLFAEYDSDASGTMEVTEATELFQRLGYQLSHEVILESLKALHVLSQDIVFEDVIGLVSIIRDREGFAQREVEEFVSVFERHAPHGHMREFEMQHALTWMGFSLPINRRHELWCKVDVDKSDMIECNEFLKMMRILRDEDVQAARSLLELTESKRNGTLREEDVKEMLVKMGHAPDAAVLKKLIQKCTENKDRGSSATSLPAIMELLASVREQNFKTVRTRAGLPDNRAIRVITRLDSKLQAGKHIKVEEMEKLLHDIYPNKKHLSGSISVADVIMGTSADAGGDGGVMKGVESIDQAFQVVRRYGDLLEEAACAQLQDAIREAHFSIQQVSQLRAAFRAADTDFSGSLNDKEFRDTCQKMIPEMTEVQQQMVEIEAKAFRQNSTTIDFYHFLRITGMVVAAGGAAPRASMIFIS